MYCNFCRNGTISIGAFCNNYNKLLPLAFQCASTTLNRAVALAIAFKNTNKKFIQFNTNKKFIHSQFLSRAHGLRQRLLWPLLSTLSPQNQSHQVPVFAAISISTAVDAIHICLSYFLRGVCFTYVIDMIYPLWSGTSISFLNILF